MRAYLYGVLCFKFKLGINELLSVRFPLKIEKQNLNLYFFDLKVSLQEELLVIRPYTMPAFNPCTNCPALTEQPRHNTRPHAVATTFQGHGCMDDLTN